LLITTGKKPDRLTREIAKALAAAVPGSRLENRGRRSLSQLISRAKALRFSRLCAIYKERGKPHAIAFLSTEGKGWEWLSPKIIISKAALHLRLSKTQSCCLEINGPKKASLLQLISPANSPGGKESEIKASQKKITVAMHGKKALELEVSYEK